jgi:oxygen-independent coproporphyrinogen-3 oxidase
MFSIDIRNEVTFDVMAGLYVHIPFCKRACHYCDFHFSTNAHGHHAMALAIASEISMQRNFAGTTAIETIYLGGGTPSLLPAEDLKIILDAVRENFLVSGDAELTIEGNPDDLSEMKLDQLKHIGFNRLSIGIQSFDDDTLRFINRAHDAEMSLKSFAMARAAGFNNISIDLMYAIPGQDMLQWKKNIEHALALNAEHISAYSLTIEARTAFGKWQAEKKITSCDDDESAAQLTVLIEHLERSGYQHYEVSNFAKPGFISRHNSSYWKGISYLGVGPSAHSYNGVTRQFNVSNNRLYIKSIHEGKIPGTIETLTREDMINDYVLTSLRTSWGIDLSKLRVEFSYDLLKIHGDYVHRLIDSKHAVIAAESLILTKSGRFLADKIASDMFAMTYS